MRIRRLVIWGIAVMLVLICASNQIYTLAKQWASGITSHVVTWEEWSAPAQKNKKEQTFTAKNVSDNDLKLMANAVYGESRGEPYVGQVAVAAVILNRVKSSSFPNTPSGVVFEPLAFTAVADGQIWLTPNETAKKAVQDALKGWDPTDGCTYYFNPETATSKWIWSRPQVKKIGKHIFCR